MRVDGDSHSLVFPSENSSSDHGVNVPIGNNNPNENRNTPESLVERDVAIFVARTRMPRGLGGGVEKERSEFKNLVENVLGPWPSQSVVETWLLKHLKVEAMLETLDFDFEENESTSDTDVGKDGREDGKMNEDNTISSDTPSSCKNLNAINTFTKLFELKDDRGHKLYDEEEDSIAADGKQDQSAKSEEPKSFISQQQLGYYLAQFRELYSQDMMSKLWLAGAEDEYDIEKAALRRLGHEMFTRNSRFSQPSNGTFHNGYQCLKLHHMLLQHSGKIFASCSKLPVDRICTQYADGVDCIWNGIGAWKITYLG